MYRATWVTFKPELGKKKKNPPRKNFLYFRKWNVLASRLKKFLTFPEMERSSLIFFLYFRKELSEFRKWNSLASSLKRFSGLRSELAKA